MAPILVAFILWLLATDKIGKWINLAFPGYQV